MKTHLTISVLFSLVFTASISAQHTATGSDPTDVTVVEKSWHKVSFGSRTDSDPLRPNEDLIRQTRAEKAEIRNRDYSLPQSTEPRMPIPPPRPIPSASRSRELYIYKLTLKNSGAKKIKAIDWEYQFLHPDTEEVMGSRRIVSKVKLLPGKTEVIQARLLQQPVIVVSADQLDKKYADQFKERVIIHRIYYTDGSSWQRLP